MYRKLIISLIIVFILLGLFLAGNITNLFSIQRIKDNALQPAMHKGNFCITSKLKSFTYNDVVCFSMPSSSNSIELVLRRVAGLEGDTIEFNDGYLLRNGSMVDNPEDVMFNYYVRAENVGDFNVLRKMKLIPVIKGDSVILSATYSTFNELSRHYVMHTIERTNKQKDPEIYGSTDENHWNGHNDGPFVVPKGQCFVVSDNRDNYKDSRHWGCIPLSGIKATKVRIK